jgi:acyl carrier protein
MTSPATPAPGEPPNAPGDASDVRDTSSPPSPAPRALPTACVAPRNELESQLAHLWESVLSVVPIGVDDDFFDLGGESLHAFALISRVQRDFGVTLSPRDFFACASVGAMAAMIDERRRER